MKEKQKQSESTKNAYPPKEQSPKANHSDKKPDNK